MIKRATVFFLIVLFLLANCFSIVQFVKSDNDEYPIDIIDYVDQISNVDGEEDKGIHSNFTAMQYGPDSVFNILTEENIEGTPITLTRSPSATTGTWTNPANAYADGGTYASVISATPSGTQTYSGYGFNIPSGVTITSVRVRCDAWSVLSTITYVGAGGRAAAAATVTPALPSGLAVNDICILVATTIAGGAVTITSNGGGAWTAVPGTPIDVAGGEKLYVWWRRHASGDASPTLQAGGNHICAGIAAWRNCITSGSPIDVYQTGTETTSDTSFVFPTTISTTVDGCMCICICSTGADSNAAQFSAWANANLTSVAERMDYCTNIGGGGGFALAEGYKATAGAVGTWSATLTTATPKAYITFALKPDSAYEQLGVDVSWNGGTNWSTAQLTNLSGTETTYWYNVTNATSWTPDKLSDANFRVRVVAYTVDVAGEVRLDWIPVEVTYTPINYELDLEVQWIKANYTLPYEELCIFVGSVGAENLRVDVWTGTNWTTIINALNANQWNNVSVTAYLTSEIFTIRFKGTVETNDTRQDSWQIDCVLLHAWDVGYSLSLRVMDWDLTDAIGNAKVTMNNGTDNVKYSSEDGWANYTGVIGNVTVTVHYFEFLVNETSLIVSANTTLELKCRLYDVYVKVLPANQKGILYTANVTVFNSTSVEANKIRTALSNQTGYAYLPNLPGNALTFTVYAKDYSVANVTRTPTGDEQILTPIICDQNYADVDIPWKQVIVLSSISLYEKVKSKRKG